MSHGKAGNGSSQPSFLIVEDGSFRSLNDRTGISAGLESLIEQELIGRRSGHIPPRVLELLTEHGFAWEPSSEPGHMRFFGPAAIMMERARRQARAVHAACATDLEMPFDPVEGVRLVDEQSPRLQEYLQMIAGAGESYGTGPYRLAEPANSLLLRQTSCLQKFSIARDLDFAAYPLPRYMFEISDSFRREPVDDLELCSRLRKFTLPEAHVYDEHTETMLSHAQVIARHASEFLGGVTNRWVVLLAVTHAFDQEHRAFIAECSRQMGVPMLLKVMPPDTTLEDGVLFDLEYKFVDVDGYARELSTFQLDRDITAAFGVNNKGFPLKTLHVVLTGGIERSIYAAFDRVVQAERANRTPELPLWLTPYIARVIPQSPDALDRAHEVTRTLTANDVPTDLDDRPGSTDHKIAQAGRALIPFVVTVNASGEITVFSPGVPEPATPALTGTSDLITHLRTALLLPTFTQQPRTDHRTPAVTNRSS